MWATRILAGIDPSAIRVIQAEHLALAAMLRSLVMLIDRSRNTRQPRREAFESAARRYVELYLRHMSLEESTVLPAARESLVAEDWHDLDAAFEANRDPLAGHDPSGEYGPLFRRIVNTAPAPIGLG